MELAAGDSADLVEELEQLYALVGEATADIRRLVHDLRPPVLDQLGLVPALQQHVECFGREAAVAVTIHADRNLRVRPAAEVALFRVAQEALLNVHKHARATRVDVRVEQRQGEVVLEVTDDGVGLADDSSVSGRGAGLRGMRYRADLLGGRVDVARNEGGGTRLILSLPQTVDRSRT
jgi:signal transduction histidine kinase